MATEDEGSLLIRGQVMARGNYDFDQMRRMSDIEIAFLHHYQTNLEVDRQKFITDVLGVIWKREDFVNKTRSVGTPVGGVQVQKEQVFTPLTMALRPEIMDFIKEQMGLTTEGKARVPHIGGGDYQPKGNEEIKNMSELSKEEFKRMMGSRV